MKLVPFLCPTCSECATSYNLELDLWTCENHEPKSVYDCPECRWLAKNLWHSIGDYCVCEVK